METFTCGNCSKDFSIAERTKVHWVVNVGAVLITMGMWWPSNLCASCHNKVAAMGVVGLLISTVIVIAVLFKLLGQALA
jgi:hypothetical protein